MMSRSHRLRQHASEILTVKQDRVAWVWMLTTGFSTFMPLFVGITRGEGGLSIFGALTGYFVGLTDHQGSTAHRLLMAFATVAISLIAFCLGIVVQTHIVSFVAISALMVYLLGILGGNGAEFERLLLLAGIDFFVAKYAPTVHVITLLPITMYFGIALVSCWAVILFSRVTIQRTHGSYVSIAQAVRHFFTKDPRRHFYAITYTCAILAAIVTVDVFEINRGYWTVITALLMMKPDRRTSLYRIVQRLVGTLLGVAIGQLLIIYPPPIMVLALIATCCATGVPFVWNRNYWLVSFCATLMVIALLSIAMYGHLDPTITVLRVKATLWGCAVSVVIILLFRVIERWVLPRPASASPHP